MRSARRGLTVLVAAGALAIAGPGAAAVATAQAPPASSCLIEIDLSWLNLGIQPIKICI